jgi:hypothetical protein
MSTPAFKIISQEPISKEEYEKEMNKKRSLPTRDEIVEEYNKRPNNDDAAQVQKAYDEIVLDIQKRKFEFIERGYISFVDIGEDFDSLQMVKLFKLIVANPGYQIGLSAEYSNWEHIPIPNNLLDWEDLTKVFPTDSFLIYLK